MTAMTEHHHPKNLKTLLAHLTGRLGADRIAPEARTLPPVADGLILQDGKGLAGLRDQRVSAERASDALATLDRIRGAHRPLHPSAGAALNAA